MPGSGVFIVDARDGIDAAAAALERGEVVVIPTDTVYGVAVDPSRLGATDRLFDLKRRPRGLTLPVLVGGVAQVGAIVSSPPVAASALMDAFWPGALTIVLDRDPGLSWDLGDEGSTIGVRCPGLEVVRQLCWRVGPLATTSANLHGEQTPETAESVAAHLLSTHGPSLVLDGGVCAGAPSTVVSCAAGGVRLVREGRIPWSDVMAVVRGD